MISTGFFGVKVSRGRVLFLSLITNSIMDSRVLCFVRER